MKRIFIEGRTISNMKRRTERTSCRLRNLNRTEGSQMDRKGNGARKSLESKGMGLPKKVEIFLSKTQGKT